jgi:hypothetical protein
MAALMVAWGGIAPLTVIVESMKMAMAFTLVSGITVAVDISEEGNICLMIYLTLNVLSSQSSRVCGQFQFEVHGLGHWI